MTRKYLRSPVKKTLDVCMSTNDTKRVIMAVTITADSTLLPSILVHKGKLNGKITMKGFSSGIYLATHFYQEAAWIVKVVIIVWVNEVLAPYAATAPDHVIPILILDMY